MIFIHTSTSTHTYCTVYTVSGNKWFDYAWYVLAGALSSLPVSNKTGNTRDLTVRELAMQHFKCVMNKHLWTRTDFQLDYICLSTGVTWGKIVSLYAVAGALAVDCVRHGHPAMVHTIVDCMGEFVRKSLLSWLKRRGGWVSNKSINSIQFINKMYAFIMLLAQKYIILDSDWSVIAIAVDFLIFAIVRRM